MTQCAGLCYYDQKRKSTGKGTFAIVRLSTPLLKFRSLDELKETLLHEMIHAFLFVTKTRHERKDGADGHGPDFLEKMKEINKHTGLKLSVYHTFGDECDLARPHVWLCDGLCAKYKPYFGVVTRSNNRPPGPQDLMFSPDV